MSFRALALACIAFSGGFCGKSARAAGAPPIVRVYVAGPEDAVSGARDAIQDRCARANVAVVVRDAAGADEALLAGSRAPGLADAYVDLRSGSPPRVVVVDAETRQDLERRSLPEGASLEISIETVAQVVCAAVESSLAARVAPAPTPKVTAERAPPVPARPGARWQTRATVFASATDFGVGARGGAGLGLGLSHGRSPVRLGGFVSAFGFPAADVASGGASASFGVLGVRTLPTLEWQLSNSVIAFTGVGIGFDWLRMSAERPPLGATAGPAGSAVDPMATGMLGLRVHLGRGVAALFALQADVNLLRHRYVSRTAEGSESFFEPSRVRPVGIAGLSLSLGGQEETRP